MRWLDSIINTIDMNLSKLWNIENRGAWCATRVRHNLATEQQHDVLLFNVCMC